ERQVVDGTDLMVIRELTGGLDFGEPRGVERFADGGARAINTMAYTSREVERIARIGFDVARKRRKRLTSVDKVNVLVVSQLWREVVTRVGREYPDVTLEHVLVDNCAMALVQRPTQFDTIVTENTFGDILSDEAAILAGSMGMLPSASLGGSVGLYEPVHGTAPDIAGKGIANPIAAILSAAMLLRYSLRMAKDADRVEGAARVCGGALGREDRAIPRRAGPRPEDRARGLQGRADRLLLGGLRPVEGVRAHARPGGRGRHRQVERVPHGPARAARGPRDQRSRRTQPPGYFGVPELHDDRHRDAAEAPARRGPPAPRDRRELPGGVGRRRQRDCRAQGADARLGARGDHPAQTLPASDRLQSDPGDRPVRARRVHG